MFPPEMPVNGCPTKATTRPQTLWVSQGWSSYNRETSKRMHKVELPWVHWNVSKRNTQKYVVTFTTSQSYIEVQEWRKGDIAFSFRTTGEKAILLYQPPIRSNYPSFMVALTSEYRLTFNFTLNTGTIRELEVKSRRKLNNGEWQKIWIDYNDYHVRFMINTDFQMVDLLPEEEFGPFEGSMFIGGATAYPFDGPNLH